MGDTYFPNDSNLKDLFNLKFLEVASLVQFLHRNTAYLILLLFFCIFRIIINNRKFNHLIQISCYVFAFLILQIVLGISTILSGTNIIYASIHQIGSIFLITSSIILIVKNYKN
jgi:heme a synthase